VESFSEYVICFLPAGQDWNTHQKHQNHIQGHLRFLSSPVEGDADQTRLFFIRNAERGRIYILSIPDRDHPDYAEDAGVL